MSEVTVRCGEVYVPRRPFGAATARCSPLLLWPFAFADMICLELAMGASGEDIMVLRELAKSGGWALV